MGNGRAAMDLMGQWAPSTFAANTKDKKGLGKNVGWFPFPSVDGGAGQPGEQFGGGDGFAIGRDAPPETVDFAKFLVSPGGGQQGRRQRRHPARREGRPRARSPIRT